MEAFQDLAGRCPQHIRVVEVAGKHGERNVDENGKGNEGQAYPLKKELGSLAALLGLVRQTNQVTQRRFDPLPVAFALERQPSKFTRYPPAYSQIEYPC